MVNRIKYAKVWLINYFELSLYNDIQHKLNYFKNLLYRPVSTLNGVSKVT